jgi:hypothetical protein
MRRISAAASTALCLGAALALGACATPQPSESGASPLALDFLWSPSPKPTLRFWPDTPPPPKAVVLHWNAKDYTQTAINEIAGQQCITFGREAESVGRIRRHDGTRAERFDCVVATKDRARGRG